MVEAMAEAERVGRVMVVQRAMTAVREYEVGQEPAKIAGLRCGHCRVQRRLRHCDRCPSTDAPLGHARTPGVGGAATFVIEFGYICYQDTYPDVS